ncbi:hypothetical protein BV25DRAFT_1831554 [Artomyces pyxidatus]|uniref:Uncharacterized protein n=1 Tax=Artomyces pyxidatus TaxID=48021 RepID=A0ACB8SLS9_9AGAM|nr:hypothetical protein BV25DRAFT_1831554 [Artomyces pyxidatus]
MHLFNLSTALIFIALFGVQLQFVRTIPATYDEVLLYAPETLYLERRADIYTPLVDTDGLEEEEIVPRAPIRITQWLKREDLGINAL